MPEPVDESQRFTDRCPICCYPSFTVSGRTSLSANRSCWHALPSIAATPALAPAYHAAGWRDPGGGTWTWHSLRHVFCTTALSGWHLEPADVSCMAGHANIRVTLDMYVGATAGVLDRARTATQ